MENSKRPKIGFLALGGRERGTTFICLQDRHMAQISPIVLITTSIWPEWGIKQLPGQSSSSQIYTPRPRYRYRRYSIRFTPVPKRILEFLDNTENEIYKAVCVVQSSSPGED